MLHFLTQFLLSLGQHLFRHKILAAVGLCEDPAEIILVLCSAFGGLQGQGPGWGRVFDPALTNLTGIPGKGRQGIRITEKLDFC